MKRIPHLTRHERDLPTRARNILIMLAVEFLLGMGLNLIAPPQDGGDPLTRDARIALLTVHGLIGVALIIAAVVILAHAPRADRIRSLAYSGVAGILGAFLAGILTVAAPDTSLCSFLMAASFLAASGAYVVLWAEALPPTTDGS